MSHNRSPSRCLSEFSDVVIRLSNNTREIDGHIVHHIDPVNPNFTGLVEGVYFFIQLKEDKQILFQPRINDESYHIILTKHVLGLKKPNKLLSAGEFILEHEKGITAWSLNAQCYKEVLPLHNPELALQVGLSWASYREANDFDKQVKEWKKQRTSKLSHSLFTYRPIKIKKNKRSNKVSPLTILEEKAEGSNAPSIEPSRNWLCFRR